MPPSKLPWYQFSLRSLLELTFFVAVFCSVGVCTGWVSLVVLPAIVLVSGLAGRVVAGVKAGFVEGAKCGTLVFAIMSVGRALAFSRAWTADWYTVVGAAIIGGVIGGLGVRPRSAQ